MGFSGIDECAQLFRRQDVNAAIGLAEPAFGLERLEQLPCWMTRQSRRRANVLLADVDWVRLACMSTAGMMQEHRRQPPVTAGQEQISQNIGRDQSSRKDQLSEILPPVRTVVQHAARFAQAYAQDGRRCGGMDMNWTGRSEQRRIAVPMAWIEQNGRRRIWRTQRWQYGHLSSGYSVQTGAHVSTVARCGNLIACCKCSETARSQERLAEISGPRCHPSFTFQNIARIGHRNRPEI